MSGIVIIILTHKTMIYLVDRSILNINSILDFSSTLVWLCFIKD